MRILVAQIDPTIGDLPGNAKKIVQEIQNAKSQGCDIVLFPEMAVIGYPPEDFLLLNDFVDAAEASVQSIAQETSGITAIVGTVRKNPHKLEKPLFNSAAILAEKKIVGYQDKCLLPTYDVFSERRYFEPAHEVKVWQLAGKNVGITIMRGYLAA